MATLRRDATARYVDGQYEMANPQWHDDDAAWKAGKVLQFLRDAHISPETMCDIGCGTGGVLSHLAAALPSTKVTGYEPSPQALALARQLHPEVDIRQESLATLVESGTVYDVAVMCDVFEHVEDYLGFLRLARRVARYHVFHIPLDMSAFAVMRERSILRARSQLGHLHYFSKASALATLEDAGYSVRAVRYTASSVELPAPTLARRLASWPRRLGRALAPNLAARLLGGFSLLVLAAADAPDEHPTGDGSPAAP